MTHAIEGAGCLMARRDEFTLPGAEPRYAPDLAIEPRHTEVRLRFDLESRRAEGSVTHTVRANRAGARALRLDAVALLDLAVEADGDGALSWRYDGRAVDLAWREPFAEGEERAVTVRYRVEDPVSGMLFSAPEPRYPSRALFVATDHETERARYWLPCVDYPAARATFDFHLTAREELTILANGLLVAERRNGDGTKTAHWRLDFPCPSYLCCLAVGAFARADDEAVGGRPIAYFGVAARSPEMLRRTFDRTPAMMRWMERRLGVPFPFPKYFQIALPEIGGAMENISLVTWDDVFLLDATLAPERRRRADEVNVHEMAHAYFGDAVVCRHFEHSWLKESWATYMEGVWLEETLGRDERDYFLWRAARQYREEADERYVRPIVTRTYNASWDLFDRHLYPGGAWRIHMLRARLGDDAFWAAVRDYLERFSGKVVETDDFRRTLERASGLNLTRFFDEWIYAPGYPKLQASFRHDAGRGEGTLAVEQTQVDAAKGVGLFHFDLDVDWEDSRGWHRATIAFETARAVLVLPMPEPPRQLRLDRDLKALFALESDFGDDLLRRTLVEAEDVCGRIAAAEALVRSGARRNLRAVADAMAKEPFWGAREAVGTILGASLQAEAIEPLAAMLLAEREPMAMAALARACGKMRDPRLRDALARFLDADPPPVARAAALESLGAQRDERDLARLEAASRDEGIHGLVRSGALLGLGASRHARALELLERRIAYGEEGDEARPAAVEAYARCARAAERAKREHAVSRLVDLTRDPRPRVRLRAAAMLAELHAASAADAIEAMKRLHPEQDAPKLERHLVKLRKGPEGDETVALRKQVEKLEERLRKLDERLQDLEAKGT